MSLSQNISNLTSAKLFQKAHKIEVQNICSTPTLFTPMRKGKNYFNLKCNISFRNVQNLSLNIVAPHFPLHFFMGILMNIFYGFHKNLQEFLGICIVFLQNVYERFCENPSGPLQTPLRTLTKIPVDFHENLSACIL